MPAKDLLRIKLGLLRKLERLVPEQEAELFALNGALSRLEHLSAEWRLDDQRGARALEAILPHLNHPDTAVAATPVGFQPALDRWILSNQGLFNRAVWEETVEFHAKIRASLDRKSRAMTQPSFDTIDKLRKFLHLVRDFFVPEPDSRWFGDYR